MRSLISFTILIGFNTLLSAQENWPAYRGPEGNGHATSTKLPVKFSDSENVT